MKPLVRALRPQQWPKNGVVFAAFVFSAGDAWALDDPGDWGEKLLKIAAMAALWCVASSATYLVNDAFDRDADRLHPKKRHRPIASGALSIRAAIVAAIVLAVAATGLGLALDITGGLVLGGYMAVMVVYSALLKHVAILDVLVLTAGVIGRAVAGATTIDVEISPWLYVCASAGALFFAVSKRWSEFLTLGDGAAEHRSVLGSYSADFLHQMLTVTAATALLAYAVYTIESPNVPENGAMALTIPFVAFAMFRYLLLLGGPRKGDAPDNILFTDIAIVASVAGFVITAAVVLLAS